MKKLRTFYCKTCDTHYEKLVNDSVKKINCEKCDSKAIRQLSAPRFFGNTTGKSPSSRY